MTEERQPLIRVVGDVCLDVVGVPIPEKPADPNAENWCLTGETRTHFLPGGAMLLAEFIRAPQATPTVNMAEEAARKLAAVQKLTESEAENFREKMIQDAVKPVEDAILGPRPLQPGGVAEGPAGVALYTRQLLAIAGRLRREEIVHSLLALAPFPETANKDGKTKTLRVHEVHGYSGPTKGDPNLMFEYVQGKKAPEIIVLDDTGNGFRKDQPWQPMACRNPASRFGRAHTVDHLQIAPPITRWAR